MKNPEQMVLTDNALQTAMVISLLQQLLTEFDELGLSVPAIKIAEAIDCLNQP